MHGLTFGERSGRPSERAQAIQAQLAAAPFTVRLSDNILQSMWEKWTFIAAAAAVTCLMRAALGDIHAAGGADLSAQVYEECAQIATEAGYAPSAPMRERSLAMMTAAGSSLTASMLRDIESGGRTEADQILGDLLQRRKSKPAGQSILAVAHLHVKAYDARRKRELSG
jgi:2-dehydropantoate 2-reductase